MRKHILQWLLDTREPLRVELSSPSLHFTKDMRGGIENELSGELYGIAHTLDICDGKVVLDFPAVI